MAKQKTVVIIKPDAVASRCAGAIISRLEKFFEIEKIFRYEFSRSVAQEFYAEHINRDFFQSLIDFTCSGPCFVILLSGEEVVARVRDMIGSTDPYKAAKGTIRSDYGYSGPANAVHASASEMDALQEIALFRM